MKKWNMICLLCLVCLLGLCGCRQQNTDGILTDLTVNYKKNPIGIEDVPVFSWKMSDNTQGQYQTAYRIVVAESQEDMLQEKYVWDSGKTVSDISVAIPYTGPALDAEQRYYWRVCAWDKDGSKLQSEQEAYFEMGILDDDWDGAQWIYLDSQEEDKNISQDSSVFTISYDILMGESFSGLIWGADTNCYGEYFLWAFDTTGDSVELVTSRMHYEDTLEETRTALDEFYSKEAFMNTPHHVELQVNGTHVDTYVDKTLVASVQNSVEKEMGLLGLWVTRGTFYALYDNLLVSDKMGNTLYWENFDEPENTVFSPYYYRVKDGWIEASSGILMVPGGDEPAPMFRKTFLTEDSDQIVSARLYASALGVYQFYINGNKIGDDYFAPGQSYYSKEVYYRTYDVTEQMITGENVIGAVLGHGKYDRAKSDWGDELALCAKLIIRYADGRREAIVTDGTWSAYGDGPVRRDDMFWGEYYDAGYEQEGWTLNGYQEDNWQAASVYHKDDDWQMKRVAAESEPVRCVMELTPVSVTEPRKGTFVYDFGQNFNGVCKITVQGKPGQIITLRYAETINTENMSCKDDDIGTIWTQNLYTARNTDYYVLKGEGKETFTPGFVCRGFRYVQITGIEEALDVENIQGLVLTTDNERTGYFTCSDAAVNGIYNSIYWSQISNYVDTPTDCPQRDERLAWTGDAQVFASTADYNANIYSFMGEYIDALRMGQDENGEYPDIGFREEDSGGNNGWGDAGIILVWEMYQQYGNEAIIHENFQSMCRYMDYLVKTSDDFIREDDGYSDHNAVSLTEDDICNTAQCAYVALLLSKMSTVIGEDAAAEKYMTIYQDYRKAWEKNYLKEDGSIGEWLQTDYALGLAFGLYPAGLEDDGAQKLAMAVEYNDYHPSTGYIATAYLLPVLCDYGYTETAYKLLQQNTYPSWKNMLAHGATTITEGWNTFSDNGDGTFAINGSLNHYALGSVGKWMYSDMLGIKRDESAVAFKHFYLKPIPGEGITSASGSYKSMYGTIKSEWSVENGEVTFRFTIPANTTATVTLPDERYQNMELGAGDYTYKIDAD